VVGNRAPFIRRKIDDAISFATSSSPRDGAYQHCAESTPQWSDEQAGARDVGNKAREQQENSAKCNQNGASRRGLGAAAPAHDAANRVNAVAARPA
jgi:hypothetical protein